MATKKRMTEQEYKGVTLKYKWMFVDMVSDEDVARSYLGISIFHNNGWTKPRPITIEVVRVDDEDMEFYLDVSFIFGFSIDLVYEEKYIFLCPQF